MRLLRVQLWNYRGITASDVSFSRSGVTIVEGPNEAGKTSIAEALQLAIDSPDSSRTRQIKAAKPADRDEGPEVEIALSSGEYELTYRKRWLKSPQTTLKVTAPLSESLTGREAHDRLKEILDETLDEQLWRALRIEQGKELSLPLFNLPSMGRALDSAAGGDLATDREDDLWDRIGEEYDKHWTPKGQPKGTRVASANKVDEAKNKVAELTRRLDEVEEDANRINRLIAEAVDLETTLTNNEDQEAELTARWESTQSLRNKVERLMTGYEAAEAKRDRAVNHQQRRQELIDALIDANAALTDLEAEAEQAAPALAASTRRNEEAATALAEARSALRSAQAEHRLAIEDRDHLRQKIEVVQLRERHEQYIKAAQALSEAEEHLNSAKVDDDIVEVIERAHLDHERAKAAADSAAASIETTALSDVMVSFDGDEIELSAGEVERTLVDNEVTLVIADAAQVRVSAGPDSKDLADERSRTQQVYLQLCEEAGVVDLAEARLAAQQRQEALHKREGAKKEIERALRDLNPETLLSKVKGLTKRVDSYPQERSADAALPEDHDTAQRTAGEMERALDIRQDESLAREETAEEAAEALHESKVSESVLAARVEDARNGKKHAASQLADAREVNKDAALTAELASAQQQAEAAEADLKDAQSELDAADPESLEALLDNAREATRRAVKDLQTNSDEQNKLRGSLDLRGEQGLHTLHSEALSRLEHLERRHDRTETRARVALLLKETFEKHRRQARQRYIGPFKAQIDRLGRIVFGPTFAVELSDDLQVVRRTLGGTTLDVDQLSTGAREQIGVLSRLACAAIVSPDDGGVPVMIDDALGWSDPQRLHSMGAAIMTAGKQCQVIVLTCTPGRYSNVGEAEVVKL